jgi:predicted DNA-binding transcriptional regulator AlpA
MHANTLPATLRPNAAAAYLGFSVSTLWSRAKNYPDFPKPFKDGGGRMTFWMRNDLDEYIAKLHAAHAPSEAVADA